LTVRATRSALAAGRALIILAALLAVPLSQLPAQSWRTLDVSRQLHDSGAHQVSVQYGAGRLSLHAARAPLLYDMRLRYDAERTTPFHSYSAASRTLELGVRRQNLKLRDDQNPAELQLDLADRVPLNLSLELGAVEADLDLSRLRLTNLAVESGASETTLRFDTPNPTRMRSLRLEVGAASVTATRLANANTRDIRVHGGVGSVDLDLGGNWTQDVVLTVDMAVGSVRVRVPSDVGVRVEMEKLLASFDHGGLVEHDGAYFSDNWDNAPYKLRIKAETTLGKFELYRR